MLNNGEWYDSVDDEFLAYQHTLVQRINEFNRTDETPEGLKQRDAILKEICGTYGENLYIISPVYANCGLRHVHFGKDVVVNFDCKFVDDGDIFIGDNTLIGPGCTFATADTPYRPGCASTSCCATNRYTSARMCGLAQAPSSCLA